MKTRFFALLFLLGFAPVSLFFQSCNKIKDLAKFDVTQTLPTVSVPIVKSVKSSLSEQYYQFSQYVNLDSIKSAHNISSISLSNGQVTGALITVTAPAGANLAFLNSARLTLFNSASNELQVAHTGTIDPISNSVQFILDVANITPFLNSQHFTGRLYYDVNYAILPAPTVLLGLSNTLKFTVSPL